MRIVTTISEFKEEVKIIDDWRRLHKLGLFCKTSSRGAFELSETDEMIDFCKQNPQFHIVSTFPDGLTWNRFHPKAETYYLAEGNPEPYFVLDVRFEEDGMLEEILGCRIPLFVPDE